MPSGTVEEIYEWYTKPLSPAERLKLVSLTAQALASESSEGSPPRCDLTDLHRLGAKIWEGVDVEKYINDLREE